MWSEQPQHPHDHHICFKKGVEWSDCYLRLSLLSSLLILLLSTSIIQGCIHRMTLVISSQFFIHHVHQIPLFIFLFPKGPNIIMSNFACSITRVIEYTKLLERYLWIFFIIMIKEYRYQLYVIMNHILTKNLDKCLNFLQHANQHSINYLILNNFNHSIQINPNTFIISQFTNWHVTDRLVGVITFLG